MSNAALTDTIMKFAPAANKTLLAQIDFYFQKYAPQFGVTTPKRIAAFMAQAAHETGGFKYLKEIWGPTATQLGYEGRKDLGNVIAGDGKKHLGRGIFQTTGRANYTTASIKMFGDTRLLDNPALLEQPEWAVLSALHYWNDKKLNSLADAGDFVGITKKINGGTNGLTDRKTKWAQITSLLSLIPAFAITGSAAVVKKKPSGAVAGAVVGSGFRFFLFGK